LPDGPADKAGLAKGDIIIGLDYSTVRSINELRSLVQKRKIGEKVTILLLRGGRRFIAELILEKTP
jgi:S1-C subfamily serine protease